MDHCFISGNGKHCDEKSIHTTQPGLNDDGEAKENDFLLFNMYELSFRAQKWQS
jgi:hypothetical protein